MKNRYNLDLFYLFDDSLFVCVRAFFFLSQIKLLGTNKEGYLKIKFARSDNNEVKLNNFL